jgi:protein TonB
VTPPATIIQPKEPPKDETPPEAEEETEEEEGGEGGVEGGVVGGVIGGMTGGTGTVLPPPRLQADETSVHLVKISGPPIEYTNQALEHEVQGLMIVKCVVTVEGSVYGCRVLKTLPFMDRTVVVALERTRYQPYLLNGRPVEIDMTFKIRLTLPQ